MNRPTVWESLTELLLAPTMTEIEFSAHRGTEDHQSDWMIRKEYALCISQPGSNLLTLSKFLSFSVPWFAHM